MANTSKEQYWVFKGPSFPCQLVHLKIYYTSKKPVASVFKQSTVRSWETNRGKEDNNTGQSTFTHIMFFIHTVCQTLKGAEYLLHTHHYHCRQGLMQLLSNSQEFFFLSLSVELNSKTTTKIMKRNISKDERN